MNNTAIPSKVLHVRGLPDTAYEQDLTTLCTPFGTVTNVLIMRGKGQGFVEFQTAAAGTQLLSYYNNEQASIKGKNIYFQFSNRQELAPKQEKPANHILLVNVMNMVYPVGIDVLHKVFSKYGSIVKIVIFSKNSAHQSLIQYTDAVVAHTAKTELDGQNIYHGCCTLRIQFSQLADLTVKYNNDRSRDFTNPSLPPGPPNQMGGGPLGQFPDPGNGLNGQFGAPTPYGHFPGMQAPFYPGGGPPGQQHHGGPPGQAAYGQQGMGPYGGQHMGGGNQSPVLIVSGLNKERVSTDGLFMLLGVYGDVMRVKIMYNRPDTALVQFSNPQQAETALQNLNGISMHGGILKMNYSKHQYIQMPRQGSDQEESVLTRDYTNSQLHRFKVAGSRNFSHITPPTPTLHLSNLPEDATEEQVRGLFQQYAEVESFRFFVQNKRMALVQLQDLNGAVECVIALHNYRLGENNIRVSFSKSQIH
eukprot:TRINITY_DN550_c0_g1_i1.p2 TRINITY_DN550_c0_g1~~TRINITY_DN550_c0_g1_i1.p2  ORF type:complete len:474 (+),score=148.94 TRINITY_DN550_c0_g1_i1:244-1665(+)